MRSSQSSGNEGYKNEIRRLQQMLKDMERSHSSKMQSYTSSTQNTSHFESQISGM